MKKVLLSLLLLTVASLGKAQNGGMANENAALKIEYVNTNNGFVTVQVTNKDTCTANIRVQWGQLFRSKDIAGLQTDTFNLPNQTARFIMAGSVSPCRGYQGQVEIDYITVLPITFEYIYVRQVSERIVNVQFRVSEADGTDRFNIQVSKDGVNFKTVSVILPDTIQTNRIYNVNVKL